MHFSQNSIVKYLLFFCKNMQNIKKPCFFHTSDPTIGISHMWKEELADFSHEKV